LTSAGKPIASLAWLHKSLSLWADGKFIVLGPQDSTTLAAMAREIVGRQSEKTCPDGLPIYNFGATADEQKILEAAGASGSSLEKLFCTAGLHYYRTINSDGDLAKTVACELMRRDANLDLPLRPEECSDFPPRQSPHNYTVLISDWDTVYGEDLLETVARTFEKTETADDPVRVVRESYLRGLDGRLPNRRDAGQQAPSRSSDPGQHPTQQAAATQPAAATPETASRFESAEGQSQFDYLRRLAADLKQRDAGFYRKDGGHIAAIGVLGSDVYDKLLILQALRPEFPNANFFTTDLDALLLPQEKSRYTRNLLVASSYGLRLEPSLQADISPFRSTYQTSIFLATRLAIQKELPDNSAHSADPGREEINHLPASSCWAAPPVLFQIGRTSPQALPIAPQTASDCSKTSDLAKNDPDPFSRIQPNTKRNRVRLRLARASGCS
jgi:hypothetical protein